MTLREINQHYLESFCVWNAYELSTQSGVLPHAFMAGSPVLAARIGSFPEFVREGLNGEYIDASAGPSEVLRCVERMRDRIGIYVDGCRKTFLETFYYRSHKDEFSALLARPGEKTGDSGWEPDQSRTPECAVHHAG
jgi:glycosyltransferase involved in cell wall biosynthesis